MSETKDKEDIEKVLTESQSEVSFEKLPDEKDSPLALPVVENATEEKSVNTQASSQEAEPAVSETSEPQIDKRPPLDAPEQEIGGGQQSTAKPQAPETETVSFELPKANARDVVESIFGSVNNVLHVGGGFFVSIKKHKSFYDFEEIIEVIEEQNEKNIRRIKLDEEDKALLRPIFIQLLQAKSAEMTPEQQLAMAVISIIIKKAQMVMQVRAENEILLEKCLDAINKHKGIPDEDQEEKKEEEQVQDTSTEEEADDEPAKEDNEETPQEPPDEFAEQVMEVADDKEVEPAKAA